MGSISAIAISAVLASVQVVGDAGQQREPAEVLLEANNAYANGNYSAAIEAYEALLDSGIESGHVFYNLGNAHLRAGELGEAIASYRKSLSLMPRSSDAKANLEFARKARKDAVTAPGPSALARTMFFWHFSMSRRELLFVVLALNALLWLSVAVLAWRPDSELLRWSTAGFLIVLLAFGSSLAIRTVFPEKLAVVLQQKVNARSGIGVDSVVRFELHAGTEATALDVRDGWVRLELSDGKQGWVERGQLAVVTL